MDFEEMGDGGERDDSPVRGNRDRTEYPDEGEHREDFEDWEEGERPDEGEHDDDGEHPEEEKEEEENEEASEDDSSQGKSGGSVAGATAVVAIVTAVTFLMHSVSGITAEFNYLKPHGSSLDYGVHVSMEYIPQEDTDVDWSDTDTGLVLVAENSQESISIPLVTSDEGTDVSVKLKKDDEEAGEDENPVYDVDLTFQGTMEGLIEKHPYRVAVIGQEDNKKKVYCSEELKTEQKLTEIRGITGKCTCTTDGNYTFSMDYTDDNNYYSDFSYELQSPEGELVKSGKADSLKEKIVISGVDELEGDNYVLVIRFRSTCPSDIEAENVDMNPGEGIRILTNRGTVTITQNITL